MFVRLEFTDYTVKYYNIVFENYCCDNNVLSLKVKDKSGKNSCRLYFPHTSIRMFTYGETVEEIEKMLKSVEVEVKHD